MWQKENPRSRSYELDLINEVGTRKETFKTAKTAHEAGFHRKHPGKQKVQSEAKVVLVAQVFNESKRISSF